MYMYVSRWRARCGRRQVDLCEEVYEGMLNSVHYFRHRTVEFRLAVLKELSVSVYAPTERLVRPLTLHIIINHGGLVAKVRGRKERRRRRAGLAGAQGS